MGSQHKAAVAYPPAAVGAAVCLGIIRSGFLVFLFLVPLGVLAYCYNAKTAWFAAAAAAAAEALYSLGLALFFHRDPGEMAVSAFYFAVMILLFTWITAPPSHGFFPHPRPAYRLIIGSAAGALSLFPVIFAAGDQGTAQFIRAQADLLASLYAASSGADVVERSLSEHYMTPERIMEQIRFVALRGGAVVSCLLLLFMSRQAASVITWFARRVRTGGNIIRFHVDPRFIWALSFSLLAVLIGLVTKVTVLEIGAWNILILCAILYLVQGGGILMYFLSRIAVPPAFRFALNLLVCIVIVSPRINSFALGALVLLGIAENWVPFRAPESNGPSSTPGTEN
ncbi:MAG: YybS family protein [Spirochaetaceae bacterium]|jgi:hypothetical protein|nr:YybS family protein [Spirochaetaceae bacterium]